MILTVEKGDSGLSSHIKMTFGNDVSTKTWFMIAHALQEHAEIREAIEQGRVKPNVADPEGIAQFHYLKSGGRKL